MNKKIFEKVKKVYNEIPVNSVFSGYDFIRFVKSRCLPDEPFDGTILRELRRIKEKGLGWFINIDRQRSLYLKMYLPKQQSKGG